MVYHLVFLLVYHLVFLLVYHLVFLLVYHLVICSFRLASVLFGDSFGGWLSLVFDSWFHRFI